MSRASGLPRGGLRGARRVLRRPGGGEGFAGGRVVLSGAVGERSPGAGGGPDSPPTPALGLSPGLPIGPRDRRCAASVLSEDPSAIFSPFPRVPAPIATSDTIFELGFERTLKKQNKEQVPPVSAPEQPHRKQHAGKSAKKPSANDTSVKPGKCRSLEEALRTVSVPGQAVPS